MRIPISLLVQIVRAERTVVFFVPNPARVAPWCRLSLFALLTLLFAQVAISQDSPLRWKPGHSPEAPGYGAIAGAPATQQGPPVYVCRTKTEVGVYPGKWVNGSCKIALTGQEVVSTDYEIAYGRAEWRTYQPRSAGLLATGSDGDGAPLYSCRVQYRGYQLGVVIDNKCDFPYEGRDIVQRPPFEALYEPGNAPPAAAELPATAPPPPRKNDSNESLSSLAPSLGANNPGQSGSCRKEVGKSAAKQMVKQCLQVSPATHPPCNVDNSCSLIRSEIRRGCRLLGTRAPDFCEQY